jgi:hypothetical protein
MQQREQSTSHLPEGSREHTFLIYDAASGEIVHGHKVLVLPFGDSPSDEELVHQALDTAEQVTKRKGSSLKALAVKDEQLEPGAAYRVDPRSQKLERVEKRAER